MVVFLPPRRKGMRLILASGRWLKKPKKPLIVTHPSGYKVTCDLTDAVQQAIFYRGCYEPAQSRLIADALGPGDGFLDLGANAGHYTWLAAARVGPTGRVYAVEAAPVMAAQLSADVVRNSLERIVTVYSVAVSDTTGSLVLHRRDGRFPHAQRFLDPSDHSPGEIVSVVTLDSLLLGERIDVIKVDVEGADLRALIGARGILEFCRPRLIVVETVDEQLARFGDDVAGVVRFLATCGYGAEPIHEQGLAETVAFHRR